MCHFLCFLAFILLNRPCVANLFFAYLLDLLIILPTTTGDTGLGKSTLVNSLFMTDLYANTAVYDKNCSEFSKTLSIVSRSADLEENGVRLRLTAVDTPGFSDSLNTEDHLKIIKDYIKKQFGIYYQNEAVNQRERKHLKDTRIHCCLYFLPPHLRG
jgi:septin family protein